jgi:hypothetical protein
MVIKTARYRANELRPAAVDAREDAEARENVG